MNDHIIVFENVVKSFSSQYVLEEVSFEVPTGMTTVIAGASGQGKSVILKLILGLMAPDSGHIFVDGKDITTMRHKELNEVRMNFGVLFQGAALLDSLTVYDNVALPLEERTKDGRDEIRRKVLDMLERVGLKGHETKFPAQLSGGMKKRVGLARALMLRPRIMLFDEPTTGLDPEKSMDIYRLFYQTQQQFDYTSVIVSHDIPKIFNLADQVIILNMGKVLIFKGAKDIQGSKTPSIQALVDRTMGNIYHSNELE